jgi:hypothetical protein
LNTFVTFTAAASGEPTPDQQWQESFDGGSTWFGVANEGLPQPGTYTDLAIPTENGAEFRAVFTNSAGTATSNVATLTVTAPPPTTSVLLPASGATVVGSSWLDASASGPAGIASVAFEVSGNGVNDLVVGSGVGTLYGYLGGWDTTDVANGTYSLQSVATDKLGQSTTSAPITVNVDNPPLNTEVLVPQSDATLSGQRAVLDASASGPNHITGVQFVLSGGSLSNAVAATAAPTVYGWLAQWDTTGVANGTYTLQSEVTETGGTTALSPGITVTLNNPPPTTAVGLPANGATVSGSQYLDASASSGVTQVQYELSGGPSNLVDQIISGSTRTYIGWLGGWNTTSVPNGTYTLNSVASYAGGVTGTSPAVTFTVAN